MISLHCNQLRIENQLWPRRAMASKKHVVALLSVIILDLTRLALAQNNTLGFTNIDCGLPPEEGSYPDSTRGLTYVSDSKYITGGESRKVPAEFDNFTRPQQYLAYVRSFPLQKRHCYDIPLLQGQKYLLRGVFAYFNYDGLGMMPAFDLYLGNSKWDSVEIEKVDSILNKEIIHTPTSNNAFVCLVNIGSGTPFISALEARKISGLYPEYNGVTLGLLFRINCGHGDKRIFRYPDDLYDRIWSAGSLASMTNITRNDSVVSTKGLRNEIPPAVMRTAISPRNASKPIHLYVDGHDKYVMYLYWAELLELLPNQTRLFDFYVNEKLQLSYLRPEYLIANASYLWKPLIADTLDFMLSRSDNSTLPPILNALEQFYVVDDSSFTQQADVDALRSIKSSYNISENWEGDPCGPNDYPWKGVTCNYTNSEISAVVSLDLSSSQLLGQIAQDLASLKSLQTLDLSNNSLTGPVPGFLSELSSLKLLNLSENNLTGTIPDTLTAKWKDGSLSLIATGNPNLCLDERCVSASTTKKKSSKTYLILIVVGVLAALGVAAAFAFLGWKMRSKQQAAATKGQENGERVALESNSVSLTYSTIVEITNNFQKAIGKGASGEVYLGVYDGTPVAVKIVSENDEYQQFQTEANHLLKVHHRNLTRLVGYCNEEKHLALVYEYMENGNLRDRLSDASKVLSWKQRTQIAMDSAQGLEYLHHHCANPIIHRDIKAANILLDAQLCAKISDFGFSRSSPLEQGSRYVTMVVGTRGYLDPEYMTTGILTMKSDVYSYGVVLLEIITGRNPVIEGEPDTHLSSWVGAHIRNGDIKSIIDPKLGGEFDASAAWIMVELAMDCTSQSSDSRPTMPKVLSRLQGCMRHDETQDFTDSYVPVGYSSPHLR